LADDKIKESETKVRCTKCREVFTVFPEPPPELAPPVVSSAPVVETEKDQLGDDFFSMGDESPATPQVPFSTGDDATSSSDDWNQDAESTFFAEDTASSDLDAIDFDNFEPPTFSAPAEISSKFEFNDDSAFSFEDSSLDIAVEQQDISAQTKDQFMPTESDTDFEDDFSLELPSTSKEEELSLSSKNASDSDFTFSEEDSPSNFSWGETNITADEPVAQDDSQEKHSTANNTGFDFGSFSFDQETPFVADEKPQEETVDNQATSNSSLEISLDHDNAAESIPTSYTERSSAPLTLSTETKDRERMSPSAKPLRPRTRSRQSKSGSNRMVVKIIVVALLSLGLAFGIMNREQLLKEYKNLVTRFIEKQVPIDTSGQIGLAKLSGGYVLNSQEGDLFVIRGEAINEFKGLRSSVLVKGIIYGENNVIVQSQSAYCGNAVPDEKLKKLRFKEIRDAMNNELGENLANLNIAAGKAVPCMIVFNQVPKNIKEFTIEVIDSKSGSK